MSLLGRRYLAVFAFIMIGLAQANGAVSGDDPPAGDACKQGAGPASRGRAQDQAGKRGVQTLLGHSSGVLSLAYAPDGKTLVSGHDNGIILVWDLATGKAVQTVEAHPKNVWQLAFRSDGKMLASRGQDKNLRLWTVGPDGLLKKREGGKADVWSFAFSPDGETLATGGIDQPVRLWNLGTGELRQEIPVEPRNNYLLVVEVEFSPDGKQLLWGNVRTLVARDLASGRSRDLGTLNSAVYGLFLTPDGKLVVSGDSHSSVHVWDAGSGDKLRSLQVLPNGFRTGLALSPDGLVMATAGGGVHDRVRLWDVESGQEKARLEGHDDQVRCLAFSPDGVHLATGSWDGTVRILDLTSDSLPLATYRPTELGESVALGGHEEGVSCGAFSPNGELLATASADKTIRLRDVSEGIASKILDGHKAGVSAVSFSPDGAILASASEDETIRLWSVEAGKPLRVLEGHDGPVCSVAYRPDGKVIGSGGEDGMVRLWHLEEDDRVTIMTGHTRRVWAVDFCPTGDILATAAIADSNVILWDATSGEVRMTLRAYASGRAVDFSPDGKIVAVGGGLYEIRLWEVATGQPLGVLAFPEQVVDAVVFSPEGWVLASQNGLLLWDVSAALEPSGEETRDEKAFLRRYTNAGVVARAEGYGFVAFSPDGRTIAAARGNEVVLFDAEIPTEYTPSRRAKPTAAVLEQFWIDLAGGDAYAAYQAIWTLARYPETTLPFLRDRLRSLPKADSVEVERLTRELDHAEFDRREEAHKRLFALGLAVEPALRKTLQETSSTEVRNRLQMILDAFRPPFEKFPCDPLRRLRVSQILEWIGTPEAQGLLRDLRDNSPSPWQSEEAGGALERLEGRGDAK